MGKKLSEIRTSIKKSESAFFDYLMETEDSNVMNLIQEMSSRTRVFIFSGVIRNFFLGKKDNRDIDIVLEDFIDIDSIFKNAEIKKNSFGGYKIYFGKTTMDLWYLADTWAFKRDPTLVFPFSLDRKVPSTAFFNFSSIVYSLNEKLFFYEEDFVRFLYDKKMDFVFEENPNNKLCVVNTFYYADKYNLDIKRRLKTHIVDLYKKNDKDYTDVQIKHFGRVIYPNEQIEHRVNTIFYPRKRRRKNI